MENNKIASTLGKIAIFCSILILVISYSCKKKFYESASGKSVVKLNIGQSPLGDSGIKNIASTKSINDRMNEITTFELSEDMYIEAKILYEDEIPSPVPIPNTISNKNSASNLFKANLQELTLNAKYVVVVLDYERQIVLSETEYLYGQDPDIVLDAGKNYDIVVYTINSLTSVPSLNNTDQGLWHILHVASPDDLMYVIHRVLNLSAGTTTLNLTLIRQYYLLKIKLVLDPSMSGGFTWQPSAAMPVCRVVSRQLRDRVVQCEEYVNVSEFIDYTYNTRAIETGFAKIAINPAPGPDSRLPLLLLNLQVNGVVGNRVLMLPTPEKLGVRFTILLTIKAS